MIAMAEVSEVDVSPARRRVSRFAAVLPWTVLALLGLLGTAIGQRGWGPTLAYQAYALLAVAVPGLLAKRVLMGGASLVEDLGTGFALGITGQLALWALHQWLGGPAWLMWTGPTVVIALLAVPAIRRRARGSAWAPLWFHWALAGLIGLGLMSLWKDYLTAPPIAENQHLYQDLWYHLALNNEMLRAFPLISPDAVGTPLTYHWYSNAFMAAGHLMSGVDLYSILLRQWLVPMFVACVLGTVAVARQVTDSWHVAWMAPTLAFVLPASFVTYGAPRSPSYLGFLVESPSNILGLVMMLSCAALALQLWRSSPRGRAAVGAWTALGIVVIGSTGAKPTVLPLVGCLAAGWVTASLFRSDVDLRHRISWSGLGVGLLTVVVTLLSNGAVTDTTQSGSSLQLGGFLPFIAGFREMSGLPWFGSEGRVNPAFLAGGRETRAAVIAVGWLLLVQSWHWLAALALPARRLRDNRAAWSLLAAMLGAWAVLSVVAHPGFSQVYFLRTAIPLAAVLACWIVVEMAAASRGAALSILAAGVGSVVVVAVSWRSQSPQVDKGSHFFDLAKAAVVIFVLCAVLWVVQRMLVKESVLRASPIALVMAGVLAGSVVLPVRSLLSPPSAPPDRLYLSLAELEAALWLGRHSDPSDVVASATLCTPASGIAPQCRGDQYWITGISGRRMLIAGWYYLPSGAADLQGDRDARARIALSQRLVADPAAAAVAMATDQYGVTWVFADRTTGRVSPDLARFGTVAFDNGTVQIVRLRD